MVKCKTLALVAASTAVLAAASLYAGRVGTFGETTFNATLTLFSAIQVEKVADLTFGEVLSGNDKQIVIDSNSAGVAKFRAAGDRNARVSVKVVEDSIKLKNGRGGPKSEIVVDQWNYGGNVDRNGAGKFDGNGSLDDIRVGGVAHVKADNNYGDYSGTATVRVTYL